MALRLCLLQAPSNSTELHAYNAGVQMGCWGLVIYAATAAVCSGERFCTIRWWNAPHICICKVKIVLLQLASASLFGVKGILEKHFMWS